MISHFTTFHHYNAFLIEYKYNIFVEYSKKNIYYFCIFVQKAVHLFPTRAMLKQDRTIIHVEVKETHDHFYFGSAAAMYEDSRVKNLLGIAYQTFRTKRVSEDHPYENEFVIVRKGSLNTILHDKDINDYL